MTDSRKNYIVDTINSVCHLYSSSIANDDDKKIILSLCHKMIEEAWKVEYKTYIAANIREEQMKAFWSDIHTSLEVERHSNVYNFYALMLHGISPDVFPEGYVEVTIQPKNRVEYFKFVLKV